MVKVETRIQLAIKEILEEETWKHLKTNNNFDKVLSIASLVEPYDEGPDPCEPYKETCDRVGMCMGCYDGYVYSIDWRASYNLRSKKPFSKLTEHEFQILLQAIDNEVHKCSEYCSEFICFKYEGQTCAIEECCNLFLKTRSNMKYCSICRNAENIIIHQHGYRDIKDWDCYCVRFLPDLFYGKYSKIY